MTDIWRNAWRGKWQRDPGNDGQLYGPAGYARIAEYLRGLFPALPSEPRILEVGCGTGTLLAEVVPPGGWGVGCDIDERAGSLLRGFPYVVADATDLPFSDGAFDLAYMHGVAQFLDDAELPAALDELQRVGVNVAVLDVPHLDRLPELHAHRERVRPGLPKHHGHNAGLFIARGYHVSAVRLALTIGWQFKFNAWRPAGARIVLNNPAMQFSKPA